MKQSINSSWRFAGRALGVAALAVAGWIALDATGWFRAALPNNPHVEKRWESLRKLTAEGMEIDVLVVGNSHSYTGINPQHLSTELGLNAFVLANNGTNWADSEWMIREALTLCTPRVIVLESYGLDESHPGMGVKQHLVDQIRAFRARSNLSLKLQSTPRLFTLSEAPAAWSPTLRNHHYLWDNPEQLITNYNEGPPVPPAVDDLYLGRFVRFTSGLTDSVLQKYTTDGPPVEGQTKTFSKANVDAAHRIASLCAERGIALSVITLPMYSEHVAHLDVWTQARQAILEAQMPGVPHWNLEHEASLIEEPSFFENTYRPNQHMTFNGSLIATGMIADSLRRTFGDLLPRRDTLLSWHNRFRGAGGYYAFQSIQEDEELARVWVADARFEAHHVIDVLSFPHQNDDYKVVQVRFDATPLGATPLPKILRSQWSFQETDSTVKSAIVELRFDSLRSRSERLIYRNIIRGDVELLALQGIAR